MNYPFDNSRYGGLLLFTIISLKMKKSILTLLLFGSVYAASTFGQEVRLNGGLLVLGYIENPLVGAGVGIESSIGTHFTLNLDANWGKQNGSRSLEFRPALHYYPGKEQKGFFVGPALKYINLKESDEAVGEYDDNLYALGFNLGVKSFLSDRWTLSFLASPHVTVGGSQESDVAGISAQLALGYKF